jgi:anti-anti-sigma factor
MNFDFTEADSTAVMSGDFTFSDHAGFLQVMNRLFDTRSTPVVIDLARVEFIDSAGLGMLLLARDAAAKSSRVLTLRGAKGQVRRMFAVTRFETLFALED